MNILSIGPVSRCRDRRFAHLYCVLTRSVDRGWTNPWYLACYPTQESAHRALVRDVIGFRYHVERRMGDDEGADGVEWSLVSAHAQMDHALESISSWGRPRPGYRVRDTLTGDIHAT